MKIRVLAIVSTLSAFAAGPASSAAPILRCDERAPHSPPASFDTQLAFQAEVAGDGHLLRAELRTIRSTTGKTERIETRDASVVADANYRPRNPRYQSMARYSLSASGRESAPDYRILLPRVIEGRSVFEAFVQIDWTDGATTARLDCHLGR